DHLVAERDGVLYFNWDPVEDLVPAGLLDDMFGAYCVLQQRLADKEACWRARTFDLLPPAQLAQRAAINATQATTSAGLLHTLFQAQVPRRPEQAAVVAADRTLTYQELSRHANQVGHRLRRLGILPNTLVAVVMEKG